MRAPRVKIPWTEGPSHQHLFSRTVNGYFYLEEAYQKEMLCAMMWKVAEFCGLQVLTYALMSNHLHLKVLTPVYGPISDEEFLRRYELLHPRATRFGAAKIEVIRAKLHENGPDAAEWRERQLAQMGDISEFMKLLKQRYSIWYNARHHRFGTLWAERFGNVLVEDEADLTIKLAAYVDLNAVRAGLVRDPAEYRFSGYGAAVGGDERARQGIMILTGRSTWEEAQAEYRLMLFAVGSGPREDGYVFTQAQLDEVIRLKGQLPFPTALLKRTNYFTNTLVLGSHAFVATQLESYRSKTGALMRRGPRAMPTYADWGGIFALRRPKQSPAISGA